MAAPKGNRFAVGNNGGRERVYTSVKKFRDECDAYFKYCLGETKKKRRKTGNDLVSGKPIFEEEVVVVRQPEHPTITGLTLWLGFSCLETFRNYEARNEFSTVAKRARAMVIMGYEQKLVTGKPTGSIFALKNIDRVNWQDKTIVDHENAPKSNITVSVKGHSIPFASNETEIDMKRQEGSDV